MTEKRRSAGEQTGGARVIARARPGTFGLGRWARLSVRFLLGAILAGGELFGSGAPFGVGLVAASGAGAEGLCALLGAVLGYFLFHGVVPGLRFASAAVLVFSTAFAFYDAKLYQRQWFMPLTAAVMEGATGFVYFSDAAWDVPRGALFLIEILLAGSSAALFRTALRLWEGERETTSHTLRASQYVGERLTATAQAFRGVRDSLRAAFPAAGPNDGDPARIFDRASQKVCGSCPLRNTCWEKDYVSTFNALNDALPAMLERGKGEGADFPGWFSARCVRFPQFLRAVNEETVALRYRRQYRERLRESRGAVCRQYDTLSEILSSAAAELSAELAPDPVRERKLRRYLTQLGLKGDTAVYYDVHGHLRLELEGEELKPLASAQAIKKLSALMELPLRRMEDVPGRVTLVQAEPLMAVAGVAARRREGQRESGDTGTWFKRPDGSLFVLLCDGMGSGEAAHRESALAVRLLEEFLRSGMESAAALRTVNSALALRNEESGAFTTVDLLRVDLYTGGGEVCKLGAAPTYLRRGGEVKRLTGAALPAGLAEGGPDVTPLTLAPGDCVLLVSDGVCDLEEDSWLRELLTAFDGESPKELARQVMEESERRVGAADDRTAVVIQLKTR